MNKRKPIIQFVIFLIITAIPACSTNTQVNHAGNLRDIMMGTDISPKMDLNELKGIPHLYAVGALENLGGEILIYDGYPIISHFKNVLYVTDHSFDFNATLIVYSQVEKWQSIEIPESLRTREGLETFISEISGPYGLRGKPFPFLLEGEVSNAYWHIVNGIGGENHSDSGIRGNIKNEYVRIVGFYSKDHQGIFTHHDSNMHAHVINADESIAAHLADIELGKNMVLKIPD